MPKIRQKMPNVQRAKQFVPFAALKGLDEALERQAFAAAAAKRKRPSVDADGSESSEPEKQDPG